MVTREQQILDAALQVFLRYGVRRTTMNDIATEAGIARQTLYNAYSSKEDVLRACIIHTTDLSLAAIQSDVENSDSLSEQLDSLFQHKVVAVYELLQNSPDANDLITGFCEASKQEIEQAGKRFRIRIEAMLAPYTEALAAQQMTGRQLADFIYATMHAFKQDVPSKEILLIRLDTLKKLVMEITRADIDDA